MKKLIISLAICIAATTPATAQSKCEYTMKQANGTTFQAVDAPCGLQVGDTFKGHTVVQVQTNCIAATQAGKPCSRKATTVEGYCSQHNPYADKCKGTTAKGQPCKLTPKRGETYCHYHTNS